MSYFRTAILLAALTALFMGIGFLIGGQGGMLIALGVAAAMNLFAYWNSDKMVLRMYGAHEVDARSVRKKMKDKAFARGVNRDDVVNGAADLGVDLDWHIQFVTDAMKAHAESLGLAGT